MTTQNQVAVSAGHSILDFDDPAELIRFVADEIGERMVQNAMLVATNTSFRGDNNATVHRFTVTLSIVIHEVFRITGQNFLTQAMMITTVCRCTIHQRDIHIVSLDIQADKWKQTAQDNDVTYGIVEKMLKDAGHKVYGGMVQVSGIPLSAILSDEIDKPES